MNHDPRTSKKTDTFNTSTPKYTISHHQQKLSSLFFEDPYEHINPMGNNQEDTNRIDTKEQDIKDAVDEK